MFNDIEKLIEWISSQKRLAPKVSLDKMRSLCEVYGNPQNNIKYIHVGGTNGKGSTVTFIKSILRNAGLNVGTYISPYVVKFNERISYNDDYITDEELIKISNYIISKYEVLEKLGILKPTFFEFVTLIAFIYFSQQKNIDIVILEVGLGGLLDATNIITPLASVITNIGYDHMKVLGNTLEEIAINKLGIVKPNIPLFTIQNDLLTEIFVKKTMEKKSPLTVIKLDDISNIEVSEFYTKFDYKELKDLEINLLGKYQTENASIAIELVKYLNDNNFFTISIDNIFQGLKNSFWPGRLQVVSKDPLIILDGAHNIDGINRLCEFLDTIKKDKYLKIYFAVSADKEKNQMINQLEKYADEIVFTHFNYKRSDDAINLLELSNHPNKSIVEDVKQTVEESKNEHNKIILYCGSLYFVSEVLKYFER